jgi:hypothetical protein
VLPEPATLAPATGPVAGLSCAICMSPASLALPAAASLRIYDELQQNHNI